jgi:tyrosyl-tRNA synthetase
MLAKDSVKKRINGESREGISYTEFAYQLLQGYDFLHLYEHHGVRLQVGGSDQWGNITTGTELIRRKLGSETEAFAITCPLLTRPDGTKFGKTAGGDSIWLDPEKTSPYAFYQYFLNLPDDESAKLIKVYTLLGREEIEGIIADHAADPGKRGLQRALADNFTHRVHGQGGLDNAQALTRFFFGSKTSREELASLGEASWKSISQDAQDKKTLPAERLLSPVGLLDLLFESGITESKGDARRAVAQDKSISLNGEAVTDPAREVTSDDFFYGRYMVVNRGKKNKFILELTA